MVILNYRRSLNTHFNSTRISAEFKSTTILTMKQFAPNYLKLIKGGFSNVFGYYKELGFPTITFERNDIEAMKDNAFFCLDKG